MFEGMTLAEILKLLLPVIILDGGLKILSLVLLVKGQVRYLPKWAWAVIILVVSTFGPVVFLAVGRKKD